MPVEGPLALSRPRWRSLEGGSFILAKLSPLHFTDGHLVKPLGILGSMSEARDFLLICIGLLAAYWIDQTYYGGAYGRPVADMLHNIINSYR